MGSVNLPRFRSPPVIETVLGVQFKPISQFHNGHLGAFWGALDDTWNKVTDAPPLEFQSEVFGKAKKLSGLLRFTLRRDAAVRLQIKNQSEDRMIQVQNGRFHFNWLGHSGNPYPSYDEVWREFKQYYEKFSEFLLAKDLGPIQLELWEVTYVNHIPKGSVWNAPTDWSKVLKLEMPSVQPAGTTLETASGEWQYLIPPAQGRFYVKLQHGEFNNTEKLLLTLTARGDMVHSDSLQEKLEIGHRTVVVGFKDITSTQAHDYWGLIDG